MGAYCVFTNIHANRKIGQKDFLYITSPSGEACHEPEEHVVELTTQEKLAMNQNMLLN